ncbi:helix-turn-helix domain-containing protein [Microvirga sp. RSM25]|uniref:helix-turn-helix domain-containing protein n=1 Tax=Microvirga sp. RSM25 TaxID=3273802 RepID=UPI00384D7BD4
MERTEIPQEIRALLDRIAQRLGATGKSERAAAEEAGLSGSTIRNLREGKVASPRLDTIRKLAHVLDTSVEWLAFGSENVGTLGGISAKSSPGAPAKHHVGSEVTLIDEKMSPVPIVGDVEAGAFREAPEFEPDEIEYVPDFPDREYPDARRIAFRVRGDSMNDLKPRPMLEGDKVVGLDFHDIEGRIILRDGMVVVVEQTRDGGHTREWSIKQLEIYEDRYEFCPRSTNKRHKPIVVPKKVVHDPSEDDGRHVRILALVRRLVSDVTI